MKIFVLLLSFALAYVDAEEETCGGTYRGFQYTVTSPNYPLDYPNRRDCVYNLQADLTAGCEQEFHLQFLDFNLKAAANCKGDYLQVGDRHVFCGNTVGLRRFTGKNNSLTVIFHSDEKDTDKGFKILVTALPCTLKLNPLKNQSYNDIAEGGGSISANDIPRGSYHRGVRGKEDGERDETNNSATRSTLALNNAINDNDTAKQQQQPPTPRPLIDFALGDHSETTSPLRPTGTDMPRITSYLFFPPAENNAAVTTRNGFTTTIKAVTSPSNQLLPPSQKAAINFSKVQYPKDGTLSVGALDKSSSISTKLGVPARTYGEPGIGAVDYDVQVGSDCDKNTQTVQQVSSERFNNDLLQGQNYPGSSNNVVYDPRYGFVNSNNYPGSGYNPSQNYPGGYNPGSYPSYNPGNYPNYNSGSYPNYNPSTGLPGIGYNPIVDPSGIYNPSIGYPSNGYIPNVGTSNYPGYNPEYNPINPNYNPSYNYPGYAPGYNPVTTPNYNPSYNPGYSPAYNPGYSPGFTPSYNPSYNPSLGGNYYPSYGNGWGNGFVGQGGECCRVQSSSRFSLVSPGFPGGVSSTNTYNCRYTITKSSPDVCRLRLNFRYFNFGTEDQYCSYGYVDIDGRRFCGCKTGQSIQLLFTDYLAKSISVFYAGYPRTRFGGFLIDVIQERCGSSGYYPQYPSYPSYPSYPQNPNNPIYNPSYPNYGGYIRRRKDTLNSTTETKNVRSQNSTVIFPSPVDPNPHIRNKRHLGYSYARPSTPFPNKDVQLFPSIIGGNTHDRIFGGSCQNRVFLDWAVASKEAILRNVRCGGYGIPGSNARIGYLPPENNRVGQTATACEEINVNQGILKSPLYPNNYPNNVQKCYRFNRAPNFCKLEVYVRDFELEPSQGCTKDYLSFSGENRKYCGRSLNDFRTIFDFTRVSSVEVYFVADSHGTGRGFNIGFSQLPCEELTSNL